MFKRALLATFEREVQAEIDDHINWCKSDCTAFAPEEYRRKRIYEGLSTEELQENFFSCHVCK